MSLRVAVMVDGENVSPAHAGRIRVSAAGHGVADVMRVYGNATRLAAWAAQPGYRLIHSGDGKNAADILLAIETMELALTDAARTFVLVSSDGDFSHLALRLRERGLRVIGMGGAHAPPHFRAACAAFEFLESKAQAAQPVAAPAVPKVRPAPQAPPVTILDHQIRQVIQETGESRKGIPIVLLSQQMQKRHETRISTLKCKNWRAYLTARGHLYDLDPKGPDAKVRLRPDGFEAPGAAAR